MASVLTRLVRPERVRRALFNVPGSDERKLAKVTSLKADSIVLDLEDGVALQLKATARKLVAKALAEMQFPPNLERAVRINSIGSGLEQADLQSILPSARLEAIVIPKVEHPRQVHFVSNFIDAISPNASNIRLIACIESAIGLINVRDIASCDPRLDALVFASEDYCADVGMIRTSSRRELLFPRATVVTAAAAYGLQAIDLVCVNYQNMDVLREEAQEGKEMGFTGKQAIHPAQIDIIQEVFSPSPQEIKYATQIKEGFEEHLAKGVGAFTLHGKMIDMPVVKWAEKILARANRNQISLTK